MFEPKWGERSIKCLKGSCSQVFRTEQRASHGLEESSL